MQYGTVGVVLVALQTFHYSVIGYIRAMNGDSYDHCALHFLFPQLFSHSSNEKGLPHSCSSGRHNSDTRPDREANKNV